MKITVGEIAAMLNGYVDGSSATEVSTFAPIDEADEGALTFLSNSKYNQYLYETKATAVLISEDFKLDKPVKPVLIRVKDVYSSLSVLLDMFQNSAISKSGIEQPSYISQSAQLGEDVYIGAFAYIGEGVKLGKGVKVYPQTYIGDNVFIGDGTVIYAGVKVYAGNVIGKDCTIHSGVVIGSDGFGFAPQADGKFKKIPQTGNVIIKDNVEIGANTTIDRATLKSTVIESGVKLDNLIQIAHNVEVGENTAIAAQAGISGSAKLGANCMIGGQVGIVGHITIAKGSQIGAQSGVAKAITEEGKKWFGSPADEARSAIRAQATFKKLPEMYLKLNNLEQELKKLKNS